MASYQAASGFSAVAGQADLAAPFHAGGCAILREEKQSFDSGPRTVSKNPTDITYGSEPGDPRLNLDSGTWRREFSDEEIAAYLATVGITSFFYEGDGVWSVDGSMWSIIRYFRIEDGLDKLKPFPVIEFFGERWDTAGVESSFDDVPVIWFYNPHQKWLYLISQRYRDQLYY